MNGCVYRTADNQCEKFSDPVRNTLSWCVGDAPCEARKLSNADRIRMMTDEELAEYLADIELKFCNYRPPLDVDTERWLEWLKKDAEDG